MNYEKSTFKSLHLATLVALCAAGTLISGCERQGRGEAAGERVDEIVDNVKEGENPLRKKGSVEKAGETIDEALTGNK